MDFPSACEHNRIGAASRTSGWRKEFSVYLESEGLGLQSTARSSMEWHMRLPAISHMSMRDSRSQHLRKPMLAVSTPYSCACNSAQ